MDDQDRPSRRRHVLEILTDAHHEIPGELNCATVRLSIDKTLSREYGVGGGVRVKRCSRRFNMKTRFASLAFGAIGFIACVVFAPVIHAQQYIYTNNDVQTPTLNSTTAMSVSSTGQGSVINTYSTGGTGGGGGYFALVGVAAAKTASNTCVFVSNSGSSNIAAFTVNSSNGALTTVAGSPFPSGGSGDEQYGIGLAVGANKALFAGNTNNDSISTLAIKADCSLHLLQTLNVAGTPTGMKVTHNSKYLLVGYNGEVDSFQIVPSTGALTELGPFGTEGAAAGVDISCDDSTAYFGDAATDIQVEVFSIAGNGKLTEINNFTNDSGENSNNVLLSADGQTLFVSNTMSAGVTTLAVGSGGSLTYGSSTKLNGSFSFVLDSATVKSGARIFVSENGPAQIGVLKASGTTLTEVAGSPFSLGVNNANVVSIAAVPTKVCP